MIYKLRIKCKEGFQLVEPSDFGFYLQALRVKKFSTACFILQRLFLLQINLQIYLNKKDSVLKS